MRKTAEVQARTGAAKTNRRALSTPLIIGLGALLAVQILAALALGLGGKDMSPAGSAGPLLAFDSEQVTGIRIQAADGEPVLVTEGENGWVIPSLGDLPAAESKVAGLLSKLQGLQKGLPVATSEEALKRFKVAEETFERKLTLESGETELATLYLGDSPGFRRLFVRADGDSAVYEAEIGLFDAPDKADDWSDRTLLHLDAERLKQLTFGGATLKREKDAWRLADLAEGEEQDEQAIEDAVRTLSTIDFVGVLGEKEEPSIDQEASPTEIAATLASGETISYKITKFAESDDYLLEVSNRPQRFKLAAYAAEELTGISKADLLKETEEAANTEETEESPETGKTEEGAQIEATGESAESAETDNAAEHVPEEPPAETTSDTTSESATQTPAPPTTQTEDAVETGTLDATSAPETTEGSDQR